MLTCDEALERMSEALDAPLPLEVRQELEDHLKCCPECRAAYGALFQMEDALRELGETPAPAELSARVMAQIRAEGAPVLRPAPWWKRARWRNLAGLAACAVLCLGLWYGAGLGNRENVVDAPEGQVQTSGQDNSALGRLPDETEPVPEENSAAQPAPAQTEVPEEALSQQTAPPDENTSPIQEENSPAVDSRSFIGQERPEAPVTYAQVPDTDLSISQAMPEPDAVQETAPEAGTQPQETAPDQESAAPPPDGQNETDAVLLPWGESTAWVLRALPQEAEALLPDPECWTWEEDGTRWCTVSAQTLENIRAVLGEDEAAGLPAQPWTEVCAVVLLPAEELPSGAADGTQ